MKRREFIADMVGGAGAFWLGHLHTAGTVLGTQSGSSEAPNQQSITGNGWTITADGLQGLLDVSHDRLGIVLKDVRLSLQGKGALKNWIVERKGDDQLSVVTVHPQAAWLFELRRNNLTISTTASDAILTAKAPAPSDRIPARLTDPEGVPVTWRGTDAIRGWGGRETKNPSFLPRKNPECMYFALGQVSSSDLHSLFDRKSDMAISFLRALMQRNSHDPNLLDLTIPVPGNTVIRIFPDYFTKTLGLPFYTPFDDAYFGTAPITWGSWSAYYHEVTEQDIVQNTDWIAENLKGYGFEYILLDGGYDTGQPEGTPLAAHNWLEWNKKAFPHGGKWLAQYIKSKGLRPGLWIVPNVYSRAVKDHPEWYLRDRNGKLIKDYSTPVLDHTNPEVLAFVKHLFVILDSWGFEYYKLDGEFSLPAYDPAVDRDKLYDKTIDPIVAYRNRVKLIEETVGPRTLLECGGPEGTPLNGIGYFTSYWNGYDDYNGWKGMQRLLSSINDNAFLNHIVTYLMPGEGIDVSPWIPFDEARQTMPPAFMHDAQERRDHEKGFGTTLAEAHTLTTYLALTGVCYSVASIMPQLPEERVRLLKKTLPTMPIMPIDLFSRGSRINYRTFQHTPYELFIDDYPEILDLKVNAKSGIYDVVGMTNWHKGTVTRRLSFADQLGLQANSQYIAFDFWNQKLAGVFGKEMEVDIGEHDTRVFMIHPFLNRPQLIGISRHITGAYSILNLTWEAAEDILRGSSETVAGEDYTLWIYLPSGTTVEQVQAVGEGNRSVGTQHITDGNSLKVNFQGQSEMVNWVIKFHAPAAT